MIKPILVVRINSSVYTTEQMKELKDRLKESLKDDYYVFCISSSSVMEISFEVIK